MSKNWFQSNFASAPNDQVTSKRSISSLKSEPILKKAKEESDSDDEVMIVEDRHLKKFQSIDWLKAFQPSDAGELAIHPKKLEELRSWFQTSCTKTTNKILILEGPTGCAKTVSLQIIAKENGYELVEWINSTDIENELFQENFENIQRDFVSCENQVTKFTDFLLRTSRFQSIFNNNQQILMVKDLPNTFLKKTDEFWELLRKYAEDGKKPLVFIITDTSSKSLNIGFNLFPDKIRMELAIDTINFNPIAATMMKKGIKRIVQLIESNKRYKEHFKKPPDEAIENLIEQCQGDIRNAVLNLNFASQNSEFKPPVAKKAKKGDKKKNTGRTKNEAGLGKNESVTLMHGLGRVFYPKLEMNETTKMMELTHKPENIADNFSSQHKNFIQMMHSNYVKNFSDIHELVNCTNVFSLSDCFETEYRDERLNKLNLNMAIRSVMVFNEHPASGFRKISAYASKKFKNLEESNKEKFERESKSLNNGNMMAKSAFFCDYNNYLTVIKKNK